MGKKMETVTHFIFLGSKITADDDCSHEIKTGLLLGRKAMTNLDCILKSRGTRDQIANIRWIIEKAMKFQKNIYFCLIDYAKAFDCVDHNRLWKILKEIGKPSHLTCLLRNLYAGQEGTVSTGCGTMDWFQIGKGVHQGCMLSPCLFNLYAQYIMWNAKLDESQAGIKIARRNINSFRNANGSTLMAENKEEWKSLDDDEKG